MAPATRVERIIKLTFLGLFWLWFTMPIAVLLHDIASGISLGGSAGALKMVLGLYFSAFIFGVLGKPLPFMICSLLSALLVLLVFRTDVESDLRQRMLKTLLASIVFMAFVYYAILAPPLGANSNFGLLCIFTLLPSIQTWLAREALIK